MGLTQALWPTAIIERFRMGWEVMAAREEVGASQVGTGVTS